MNKKSAVIFVMKPKPFDSLNHFTVLLTYYYFFLGFEGYGPVYEETTKMKYFCGYY
jgi:hypothetical protein